MSMRVQNASQAEHLPPAVLDLALRLGADPDAAFERVGFSQTGRMRISLKSKLWLPFVARQTTSVRSGAFTWRARFMPLGYMTVTDALEDGEGRLDVSVLGVIPIMRTKPLAALTRGELIRYLAELPLAPDAMLHNRELTWREVDASAIAVTSGTGETACEVVFALGPDKRIVSAFCADRAASPTPPFASMPWRCEFFGYRHQHGRWIPSAAQVSWLNEESGSLYWRGSIDGWGLLPSLN